jgi:ABC-type phosphate transport system substrate-binding protein
VAGDSISDKDLKAFYLNKSKSWSDGSAVTLAVLEGGATHDAFLDTHIGKNDKSFASFWKRIVFTGKGAAPKAFASEAELVAFVARTPGAIGYVDAGAAGDGAKQLAVQ